MSIIQPPTPYTANRSPDMMDTCHAIVLYHSCGCKSKNDVVYFCTRWNCHHETSSLIIGGLPFACGSQQGRSEECKIEDKAKTQFVREVDTADNLESFMVLPERTKDEITALVSPFRPLTSKRESYYQYQQRHGAKTNEYPVPSLFPSPYADGEVVGSQDIVVGDGTHPTSKDTKVGSNPPDVQMEDHDIHENNAGNNDGDAKVGLFVIGDGDNDSEFMDIELDDDYDDIYEDVDMNEKFESYVEYKGEINIDGDREDVRLDDIEVSGEIGTVEKGNGERDSVHMPSYVETVEGAGGALSPMQDKFGDIGMSDEILDILVVDRDNEPEAPVRRESAFGKVWAYLNPYK